RMRPPPGGAPEGRTVVNGRSGRETMWSVRCAGTPGGLAYEWLVAAVVVTLRAAELRLSAHRDPAQRGERLARV
ncbi:MAG TPA: hypothetical protein VHN18_17945, partial [Micromonosporaceae bacterium]|nr:hypothetical protein [Micromonosporaceae bacterium]